MPRRSGAPRLAPAAEVLHLSVFEFLSKFRTEGERGSSVGPLCCRTVLPAAPGLQEGVVGRSGGGWGSGAQQSLGWASSGKGKSSGTEPCSSLSSPRAELLHRRAFCTARAERGGRDPFARRRALLPSGVGTGMCVNAGGCQHCSLVCVCKCTCPAPPEGLLWGTAVSRCPGGHPPQLGVPSPPTAPCPPRQRAPSRAPRLCGSG